MASPATSLRRVIVSLAVNFELNTMDGLRRVIFGLEKDTQGTGIEWQIHFALFERTNQADAFGDPIVKVDVDVKTALSAGAEALAQGKPTPEQAAEIVGPVSDDAKAFLSGDLSKPEFDESAQTILG